MFGEIRGFIDKNGEPWFLAGQVCRCLGIKNSAKAIKDLKQRMQVVEDWERNRGITSSYSPNRGTVSNCSPKAKNITLQDGKSHTQVTIIPESWLYELIFASRKQNAIVFRAWVTHEVLPSLRKHGEYRMEGKLIRRTLTDAIKSEIVEKSESENEKKFAYSNFSRLVNKSLGLEPKVDRSKLSDELLEKIARRENLVAALVNEGKNYYQIKDFLNNIA